MCLINFFVLVDYSSGQFCIMGWILIVQNVDAFLQFDFKP